MTRHSRSPLGLLVLTTALLASSISAQQITNNGGSWLAPCINAGACSGQLETAMTWLMGQTAKINLVTAEQLDAVCNNNCANDLVTALTNTASKWNITWNSCGFPRDPAVLSGLGRATTQLVCYKGTNPTAGHCPSRVLSALRMSGILPQVQSMQADFTFTGDVLTKTCQYLQPSSCCMRTWAYLMAAYAQQLCLPNLAAEYLSLPGRCSVVLNVPVIDSCIAGWETDLAPLLKPRTDCGIWSGPQGGLAVWQGTNCTNPQTTACPVDACQMWCGLQTRYAPLLAQQTAIAAEARAAAANSNDKLSKWVIIFVSVFSGCVVLLLLAALIAYMMMRHKERRERNRRLTVQSFGSNEAVVGGTFKNRGLENLGSLPRTTTNTGGGSGMMSRMGNSPPPLSLNMAARGLLPQDPVVAAPMGAMSSWNGRLSISSSVGMNSVANSMAVSSLAGRASMAGRPSMAGRSSLTVRSTMPDEADAPVGTVALTVAPNSNPSPPVTEVLHESVPEVQESPVHYTNALYGNVLPSDQSGNSTPVDINNKFHPAMMAAAAAAAATAGGAAAVAATSDGDAAAAPAAGTSAAREAPELTAAAGGSGVAPQVATGALRSSRSFSFGVDNEGRRLPHPEMVAAAGWTAAQTSAGRGRASTPDGEFPVPGRPRLVRGSSNGAVSVTQEGAAAMPVAQWNVSNSGGPRSATSEAVELPTGDDDTGSERSFRSAGSKRRSSSGNSWYSAGNNSVRPSSASGTNLQSAGTPGWATPTGGNDSGYESPASRVSRSSRRSSQL